MSLTITLTLTAEEVNTIMAGLGELPLKYSSQLAGKIQREILLANQKQQLQEETDGDSEETGD